MINPPLTLAEEIARAARRWRNANALEYREILLLGGAGRYSPPHHGGLGVVDAANRLAEWFHIRTRARAGERASAYHQEARRLRLRQQALCTTACLALAIPGLALAAAAYPYLAPSSWSDAYIDQNRRTEAITLEDAGQRWLGVVDRTLTTRARDGAAAAHAVPYVAMESEAPEDFMHILVALEDRNIGTWRSLHGIDISGVLRGGGNLVAGGDGPGGSSLAAQLVRSMDGANPGAESTWVKLQRKAHEFMIAPLLYHRLGGADPPAFRDYLARHIPLVIGAPKSRMGTPLHGVGLSAQVVFSKASRQLSRAESAILAAAVQAPIILAPANDPAGVGARNARWQRVQDRAVLGLKLAYPDDPGLAADVVAVRAMPAPSGARDARGTYHPANGAAAFQLWANPEVRALGYAAGELRAAYGQLADAFGSAQLQRLNAIRLTVDARQNALFRTQFVKDLATAETASRGALAGPLTGHHAAADIIAALVKDGRIVRFYANMQEPAFYGGWNERDAQGRFDPEQATRPVGSTGKVMLVPWLAQSDPLTARYCNERHGTIQNAGGDLGGSCTDPHMWFDVRQVFARSLNLPLIWRLRDVPDTHLRDLAHRFGLHVPAGSRASGAIVLGAATGRPADLVRMIDAVGRGVADAPARASIPTIVDAFRFQGQDWEKWKPSAPALDLSDQFARPSAARFMRSALSAPVERGGTLAGIAPAIGNAQAHIGKSGTSQAADPRRDRGKFAVGAFGQDGARYAYFFMVDSRDPARGLAAKLNWQPFYPALRTTVALARPSSAWPRK